MGGQPGDVSEEPVTQEKRKKDWRMSCHVGEATEGLENELCCMLQGTGAQKWHIVSLLGDVTSPTTVANYVSMTCSDNREALTAAPTAHRVQKQAFRVHH